jgi:hypothetical protein
MKAQLQSLIQEHTVALNRICMARELMAEADGPTPVMISTQGNGAIHYAAGENQNHLPLILETFGADGWHLYAPWGDSFIVKFLATGLAIHVDHVDAGSPLLPDCCRIPLVDQAVS